MSIDFMRVLCCLGLCVRSSLCKCYFLYFQRMYLNGVVTTQTMSLARIVLCLSSVLATLNGKAMYLRLPVSRWTLILMIMFSLGIRLDMRIQGLLRIFLHSTAVYWRVGWHCRVWSGFWWIWPSDNNNYSHVHSVICRFALRICSKSNRIACITTFCWNCYWRYFGREYIGDGIVVARAENPVV